jgi:hypothetical protein
MNSKKLPHSVSVWLLLSASLLSLSACNSFPKVTQRNVFIDRADGPGFRLMCVERLADGSIRKASGDDCLKSETASCIVDGIAQPIEQCDNVTGYNPRDLDRVLTWGRNHCK